MDARAFARVKNGERLCVNNVYRQHSWGTTVDHLPWAIYFRKRKVQEMVHLPLRYGTTIGEFEYF